MTIKTLPVQRVYGLGFRGEIVAMGWAFAVTCRTRAVGDDDIVVDSAWVVCFTRIQDDWVFRPTSIQKSAYLLVLSLGFLNYCDIF